jgi:haloalkane dehalogenase
MADSTSALSRTEHLRATWLDQRDFPYVSHFVEIDGNSIHYIDEGRGPTLLFLHGLPLWSFQYRNVIRTLRTRFRCVALDYPGFGLSVARAGFRNGLSANVRLVERFIHELKLYDVTMVLHDVSTPIGIALAEQHPELIRALVLANGFGFPLNDYRSVDLFVKFLGSALFRLLAVYLNAFTWFTVTFLGSKVFRFATIHLDPLLPRHPTTNITRGQLSSSAQRAYTIPFAERSRRHHLTDLFSSVAAGQDFLTDIERRSKDIAGLPVLIAFGDMDATYQLGWHERFARMFPKHRFDPIRGGHHFPQEYDPDRFADAIQQWYADVIQPDSSARAHRWSRLCAHPKNVS